MKKVYIVLWGVDCEGAKVEGVFSTEEGAIKYLDENYSKWDKISDTERRRGCTSAFVEEWDVV